MINPKAELFRWGPIPGRPIYTSYFMESISQSFPKVYRYKWPEHIFYFVQDKMMFLCEYPALREVGRKYFTMLLDEKQKKKVCERYETAVNRLQAVQKRVDDLHLLSDSQLLLLYQQWQGAYLNFWDHGLIPELANWGGEQELKEQLQHLPPATFIQTMEKLVAPIRLSFYQEEELSLLQLKKKEGLSSFHRALQKHVQNYFWIENSYFETKFLTEKDILHRLAELKGKVFKDKGKDIEEEIDRIKARLRQAQEEKRKVISSFKLSHLKLSPSFQRSLHRTTELLSYCIWWQDARKKQIFIANHYITEFMKEQSRRKSLPLAEVEVYWAKELEQAFAGQLLSPTEVCRRQEKHCGYNDQHHCV